MLYAHKSLYALCERTGFYARIAESNINPDERRIVCGEFHPGKSEFYFIRGDVSL